MPKNNKEILSVLFDLDGTLADTSQDMCDSLNRVLDTRNLKPVDCVELKKYISRGAIGVIEYASLVNGKSIDSSLLRSEFLEDYKSNCFIKTTLNKNMEQLLEYLLSVHIKVGVVTGDMVLNAKPASDSLIKAAEIIQCPTDNIIYVGDDERDIIAGKGAGMITVAADFGFINDEININSWKADLIIDNPLSLRKYLIN